jgi:glycosyltransferase involved in cell wall biosynthesis
MTIGSNLSMIVPSRNNLKYLKWNYNSVRNLYPEVEFCVASDFSNDGTVEWCEATSKTDKNFKYMVNEGPTRLGHTILYDSLIQDVATRDFVMIWHADMGALPNMLENLMKYAKSGRVISATRIEPPLHPPGPEKEIIDCGIEPEEYDSELALSENTRLQAKYKDVTTEGIFAPWVITREDFLAINGHDPLYAPQSKEDSDIFNRFVLAGYKLLQSRDSFCYHMTCRGSRFADGAKRNPNGEVFMKNRETDEWLAQNMRSTRNFIRKWGTMVKHDSLLMPIVPHKYEISFVIKNCTPDMLMSLEPWCSYMYVDMPSNQVKEYIEIEQPNTLYDLHTKLQVVDDPDKFSTCAGDILVRVDAKKLNNTNINIISQLPEIIADSGDVGKFDLDIFELDIRHLAHYEDMLIKVDKSGNRR